MHTFCKNVSLNPCKSPLDNSFSNIDEEYQVNLKLLLAYKDFIRPLSSKVQNRSPNRFTSRNHETDDEKSTTSSISSGFVNDFISGNFLKNSDHSYVDSTTTSPVIIESFNCKKPQVPVNNLKSSSDTSNTKDREYFKNSKQIHRRSTEPPSPNKLSSIDNEDKRRSVLLIKNQLESMQSGSEFCHSCEKRVYPFERTSTGEKTYHKSCFRCSVCKRTLLPGNFAALEGTIFCKPHYIEKFRIRGKYETQSVKPNNALTNDVAPIEETVVE